MKIFMSSFVFLIVFSFSGIAAQNNLLHVKDCDQQLVDVYDAMKEAGHTQEEANGAAIDSFWGCIEDGGESSNTANPN